MTSARSDAIVQFSFHVKKRYISAEFSVGTTVGRFFKKHNFLRLSAFFQVPSPGIYSIWLFNKDVSKSLFIFHGPHNDSTSV